MARASLFVQLRHQLSTEFARALKESTWTMVRSAKTALLGSVNHAIMTRTVLLALMVFNSQTGIDRPAVLESTYIMELA
jgi:hypothetical protein